MQIHLTTYNVLANSMADTRFFKVADASVLSLDKRMPKILNELQECFDRDDIICLQEVDVTLAAAGLHQAFLRNGYYPLTAHYSTTPGRDYFGNLIAFPMKKYNLVTYGQCKIGDHILIPKPYSNPIAPQVFNDGKPRSTVSGDVYQEAAKRDTALLYATFEDKSSRKRFVVNTYHMPCAFWWPSVMTLHAEALLRKVKEYSNDLPYILIGDFNTQPNTPVYKLLTEGVINDPGFIPSPEWEINATVSGLCLTDIRSITGFPFHNTTSARNPNDSIFEAALDHIFCSPGFSNHEISYSPPSGEMPNEKSGSDHVPVSCKLTLN